MKANYKRMLYEENLKMQQILARLKLLEEADEKLRKWHNAAWRDVWGLAE